MICYICKSEPAAYTVCAKCVAVAAEQQVTTQLLDEGNRWRFPHTSEPMTPADRLAHLIDVLDKIGSTEVTTLLDAIVAAYEAGNGYAPTFEREWEPALRALSHEGGTPT